MGRRQVLPGRLKSHAAQCSSVTTADGCSLHACSRVWATCMLQTHENMMYLWQHNAASICMYQNSTIFDEIVCT